MATLYVENVPDEIYDGLKKQARQNRRSMAAEVISLLEELIPTRDELKRRRQLLQHAQRLRKRAPLRKQRFPSTEEMLREDRGR